MTKKILKLFNIGLFILSVTCAFYLLYLRFTNPDMTEMRFLIEYHIEIIVTFVALIISSSLIRADKR